jgi:Ca2+-binding EF-hand superfamily protein
MMEQLGFAMDEAYLQGLFKKFDADGDDFISPAEFGQLASFLGIDVAALEAEREPVDNSFDRWDVNTDGKLSREEVAAMMTTLGYAMDDAYLSSLFKKFDQDGDGQISSAEFDAMGQFLGLLDPAAAPAPTPATAVAGAGDSEKRATGTNAGNASQDGGSGVVSAKGSAAPQMPEGLSQMQQMAWRKRHGGKTANKNKNKNKKKQQPIEGMPEGMSKMQQMAWKKKHGSHAATQ